MGSRWGLFGAPHNRGAGSGTKFDKIPTKFNFFGVFPDEALLRWCLVFWRAEWVTVQNEIATPLRCTTPPLAGLKARGKLPRDDGLLRYVAGFFMRREYRAMERGCRSPGASTPRFCGTTPHKCAKRVFTGPGPTGFFPRKQPAPLVRMDPCGISRHISQ